MSCKQKTSEVTLYLVAVTVYLFLLQVTCFHSSGPQEDLWTYREDSTSTAWDRTENHPGVNQRGWRLVEEIIKSPGVNKFTEPGVRELLYEYTSSPKDPVPRFSFDTSDESDHVFANGSTWTTGEVRPQPRSPPSSSRDGYQADFTGNSHRTAKCRRECVRATTPKKTV